MPVEYVEEVSKQIAEVLCRSDSGTVFDILNYLFREIIRNVIEHSDTNDFYYAATYWPRTQQATFSVLDNGIGLRESLIRNPYLSPTSAREAVQLSVMPGISGRAYKGASQKAKGFWRNSGYGLYMTDRLCCEGKGKFFLASKNAGIILSNGRRKTNLETSFQGTVLRVVVDCQSIGNIENKLKLFRDQGYKISANWGGVENRASLASTMLVRNFQEVESTEYTNQELADDILKPDEE